jgi:Ser/Thr protein kinase RdoA (MazF antagonist)
MPAPHLLAATNEATLHEFAPGVLLGDLIAADRALPEIWYKIGQAFGRIHSLTFPTGLTGKVLPNSIRLRPTDPVEQMHGWIDKSVSGLRLLAPKALVYLPELHRLVDHAAPSLRSAPSSLLHGDINMWNIIVNNHGAVLID